MSAVNARKEAADEGLRDIFHVLEIHEACQPDLKWLLQCDCLQGNGRVRGKPTITPNAIDSPGTQTNTVDSVCRVEYPRVRFVRLLEDAVMRRRLERLILSEILVFIRLARSPHGGRARIHNAH